MSAYRLSLCVALAVLSFPATSLGQDRYYAIGVGLKSCALWQSDPRRTNEGIAYAYGVFTALNMSNRGYKFVGRETDAEGIIGELKKVCAERPALSFIDAIAEVYVRLAAERK